MGLLDDYSQNSDDSGGASDPGDIRRQHGAELGAVNGSAKEKFLKLSREG